MMSLMLASHQNRKMAARNEMTKITNPMKLITVSLPLSERIAHLLRVLKLTHS